MLARDDNDRVTHVGPGTPMGTAMRRYWIPALLAWELPEPDCPPVRVKLLGEELVAFRDTDGRVGLLAERCPHRQASLFLGRNEECGLRCVYHGWKFDVEGQCVEMMNEPENRASPTRSGPPPIQRSRWAASLGLSGTRGPPPAVPRFAWTRRPRRIATSRKSYSRPTGSRASRAASTPPRPHPARVLAADSARPGFKPTDPFVGQGPVIELDLRTTATVRGLRPLEGGETHVRAYHSSCPSTRSVPLATAAPPRLLRSGRPHLGPDG